jgi:hypothetical protein
MVGADYPTFVAILNKISLTKKNKPQNVQQVQIRTLDSALGSPSGPPSGVNNNVEELHPFARFVKTYFSNAPRNPSVLSEKKSSE